MPTSHYRSNQLITDNDKEVQNILSPFRKRQSRHKVWENPEPIRQKISMSMIHSKQVTSYKHSDYLEVHTPTVLNK